MTYVEYAMASSQETIAVVQRTMDEYWTPFTGHKVSLRASIEKWQDFLVIAQSGQRTASSDAENLRYFELECQVASQLKDWQAV